MNFMSGLFNSTILDVAVGLIFVYLLFAIICTTVNEWIAGIFNIRSKNLKTAIEQLLDGQTGKDPKTGQEISDASWFLKQFYEHPLIVGMHQGGQKSGVHPAYIPSRTFATAVMDIATPGHTGAINFQELEDGIKNDLPPGDVQQTLLAVIQNADQDIAKAQRNIEDWFDDTMQRVGGWYKRRTQLWTFCVAAVLTVTANADTVRIVHVLWKNPTVRAKIVASANTPPRPNPSPDNTGRGTGANPGAKPDDAKPNPQAAAAPSGTSAPAPNAAGNVNAGVPPANSAGDAGSTANAEAKTPILSDDERDELADVLGWPNEQQTKAEKVEPWRMWSFRVLGWFLTIVAVSLGAPFWFDLLNKIVNLRNAGQKPQTGQQQAESAAH